MKKNADKHHLEAVVYAVPGEIASSKIAPLAHFLTDYMKKDPDFRNRFKAWKAEQERKQQETQSA